MSSLYLEDGRGNRLEGYETVEYDDRRGAYDVLYIDGPKQALGQVLDTCEPEDYEYSESASGDNVFEDRPTMRHRVVFVRAVPDEVFETLEAIKPVLILRCPPDAPVDHCMALDWYTHAEEGVPPNEWKKTEVGSLVRRAKYSNDQAVTKRLGIELVDRMVSLIRTHPLLRSCDAVVAVPGSANSTRFAIRLAMTVAKRLEVPFVLLESPTGAHAPAKERETGGAAAADYEYECPQAIERRVIVIDDVYRSGATMMRAGRALVAAGADSVVGLVAARTLRN